LLSLLRVGLVGGDCLVADRLRQLVEVDVKRVHLRHGHALRRELWRVAAVFDRAIEQTTLRLAHVDLARLLELLRELFERAGYLGPSPVIVTSLERIERHAYILRHAQMPLTRMWLAGRLSSWLLRLGAEIAFPHEVVVAAVAFGAPDGPGVIRAGRAVERVASSLLR
jgi:hypothetical protein